MAKLKTLDQIAYVRFASVYQSFEDLEDLKREVDSLWEQKGTKPASAMPVARPTMFCSATPTLKKRSGNLSRNGSSTV
jgi:transcriptional repressor NrdR